MAGVGIPGSPEVAVYSPPKQRKASKARNEGKDSCTNVAEMGGALVNIFVPVRECMFFERNNYDMVNNTSVFMLNRRSRNSQCFSCKQSHNA